MRGAWIDGRPVALDAAVREAAAVLGASRLPVIAGLGTDVAGTRAAIGLAERLGGVIDHMHSPALMRDLEVLQRSGMMFTTLDEASRRGDLFLLVGPRLGDDWPELQAMLSGPESAGRRIIRLCSGRRRGTGEFPGTVVVGRRPEDLPGVLAAIRARLADRPITGAPVPRPSLGRLVTELKAARFGIAVWSAGSLDDLSIEMLCGLVKDLNHDTRFSGLPVTPEDNAAGVVEVCAWMTGFPTRIGFGRARPEHDAWRYDARRLVEEREADSAVWISAYRPLAPDWDGRVATIALTAPGTRFREPPRVRIDVGCPGIDHDAVGHLARTGTLVAFAATRSSGTVSVADAIGRIAVALPRIGGREC